MSVSGRLIQHLEHSTGQALGKPKIVSVGGGDINAAYRLQASNVDWFIKLNSAERADMFHAEARGLQELASANEIRVPHVIAFGEHEHQAYLVLEHIELGALRGQSANQFGKQLARLHKQIQPFFGWHINNTIGSTPQINAKSGNWITFWQSERLAKQLQFAAQNGFQGGLQSKGEKLLDALPAFFSDYQPHPSLLHGDLWGGNAATDKAGNPVIFHPACYYGDRETDIAMTELFGGFSAEFYSAYQAEYPMDAGYKTRKYLYNLYHILNHLNLFGAGYLNQATGIMDRLISDLK